MSLEVDYVDATHPSLSWKQIHAIFIPRRQCAIAGLLVFEASPGAIVADRVTLEFVAVDCVERYTACVSIELEIQRDRVGLAEVK